MTPTPTTIGMHLCDYILVEEGTRKFSLIGCFTAVRSAVFPTDAKPFFIAADLTDAIGTGAIEFVVARTENQEVVFRRSRQVRFESRLTVVQYGLKVTGCRFPAPGRYEAQLLVDGEWVAQRVIDVRGPGVEHG